MRHLLLIALVASATPALAADFSISGGPPGSGGGLGTCTAYGQSGTAPIAGVGACTGNGLGNSGGASRADFVSLGAVAAADQYSAGFSVPSIWESGASFQDGITFTSADPTATHVAVSMDVGIDGQLRGTILNPAAGGVAALDMTAEVRLGSLSNYSLAGLHPGGSIPVDLLGFTVVGGSFNVAGSVNAVLRTPTYMLPVNQPLFFSMRLASRVGALGASGSVDFLNTFKANNSSRVFNLGPGVTANAGTWLINNQLPGTGGVPEPASWAMLLMGFGLTGAVMRRRTHRAVAA